MADKKKAGSPKTKQPELSGVESPEIRNKVVRALELKEEIGGKHDELQEVLDDVRKMMKDMGKKTLQTEDDNGTPIIIKLVPTGEKVTLSRAKKAKEETLPV